MADSVCRILIVDDEKDIREGLRDYLQRALPIQVDMADNGYAALEMLKSTVYAAVLLDIAMPGISGREVLKNLRRVNPDMAVFVLTRWDSHALAQEITDLKAEYIPKPYSLKVVKARLVEKLGLPSD